MRLLRVLRCAILGHRDALVKERGVEAFAIRGVSGVPLGEMKLCARCSAVYWDVDPIVKASGKDINQFDDDMIKVADSILGGKRTISHWGKA